MAPVGSADGVAAKWFQEPEGGVWPGTGPSCVETPWIFLDHSTEDTFGGSIVKLALLQALPALPPRPPDARWGVKSIPGVVVGCGRG